MNKIRLIACFVLSLIIIPSCVTYKKVNYFQNTAAYKTDSSIAKAEYKLQVGDQVYVNISTPDADSKSLFNGGLNFVPTSGAQMQSLDLYLYTIYADSCIDFPFAGSIKIAGKTTRESKDLIKQKLSPMIKECDVDVQLSNCYFTKIGNAGAGKFPITKERLTIFQALAISGDLQPFSDRKKIKILRPTSKGTIIKTFDVRSKDIINSEFYYVQPNDIIYVQAFNGQFWGITSFTGMLSTVVSTVSCGYLLYNMFIK